jgi:cell division septum initiation protein DivIVA
MVEIDQLMAINWNVPKSVKLTNGKINDSKCHLEPKDVDTDFFDQAMRQRDLEQINKSMNKVNDIYEHLAGIVESQQEKIDKLEVDAEKSKSQFDAAASIVFITGL